MYGPTTGLPETVIDAIAQVAAAELNRVAQLVPPSPAAELGRLGRPQPDRGPLGPRSARVLMPSGVQQGSAARAGMAGLQPLLAERLLGALELTVAALDLPVPQLVQVLPDGGPSGRRALTVAVGSQGEMVSELSKLDGLVPGATDMVASVVAAVAEHPLVAPQLTGTGSDEAGIAAAHGARHLALTVVVATIVLRPLWPAVTAPAIIGTALGVVAPILRDASMPASYAEAALAKRRAEYLMPRYGNGRAVVADHVFTLAEGPLESTADFSENGLVAVLPNGIAVRTAQESGSVSVGLHVVKEPPEPDASRWDEIVEVGWRAPAGGAALSGSGETTQISQAVQITPPWPGEYRARVCASGRDGENHHESYQVVVWRAEAADPVVHKHSDRLGYSLRGEAAPPVVRTPDEVYHWIERSHLSQAATVTFVAGKSGSEVLRAFGADESAPAPIREFERRHYSNTDPWACVLDVPGGAVAVEFNGWEGSNRPVLRAASSPDTLAASMFWNINAVRRFSLARNGNVLTNTDLYLDEIDAPEALELLADLDVEGRHRNAVGLLAASRFTGVWLSAEDLDRIQAVDIGYPILPLLPELYAERRLPDGSRSWPGQGPLGADTDRLATLPDDELREFAWWVAAFAVEHSEHSEHSELSEHSVLTATLAARSFSPEAEELARRSQLHDHNKHRWLWTTLHQATNPDPLGAAIRALDAARNAVAGHAAELLEQAQARLPGQAVR
ncbi:DUF6461 domain-containing protein [Catenulispora sp. GP43]|uniref:DUF6461 domain-containing protein n=1 Tax=Catenulispora sp. GP43 TaxID=3156263 RepID=UPI0035156759